MSLTCRLDPRSYLADGLNTGWRRSGVFKHRTRSRIVPYLLLQAFSTYEQSSTLGDYNAFVASMKGTTLQFVRGLCSHSYIRNLVDQEAANTFLQLCLSEPYDRPEQKDRKGFVRMFIGLIRYLYELLKVNDD